MGIHIFHTMHNLSYSQLRMSKVLKATMQVYGRKSPDTSQGKHIMLATCLTCLPYAGSLSQGEDTRLNRFLGEPGMVMLPPYEALAFLIRHYTKSFQLRCICNCG